MEEPSVGPKRAATWPWSVRIKMPPAIWASTTWRLRRLRWPETSWSARARTSCAGSSRIAELTWRIAPSAKQKLVSSIGLAMQSVSTARVTGNSRSLVPYSRKRRQRTPAPRNGRVRCRKRRQETQAPGLPVSTLMISNIWAGRREAQPPSVVAASPAVPHGRQACRSLRRAINAAVSGSVIPAASARICAARSRQWFGSYRNGIGKPLWSRPRPTLPPIYALGKLPTATGPRQTN